MRTRLALLVLLAACDRPAGTAAPAVVGPAQRPTPMRRVTPVAHEPVGAGVLAVMDLDVDPCTDFYRHACGGWLRDTVRPPDKPTYGRGFVALADRNSAALRAILERAARSGAGPVDGKLGAFWRACTDEAAHERAGVRPLAPLLARIAGVKDAASMLRVVGSLHAHHFAGLGPLLAIFVVPDARRPGINIATMVEYGAGLPDRDFYRAPAHAALRAAYQRHVARMLGLLGESPAAAAAHAASVVAFEVELAAIATPREQLRDPEKTYNLLGVAGLQALDPATPWSAYFAALGDRRIGPDLNVMSPEYFRRLGPLLRRTDAETLRAYLRWLVLHDAAPELGATIATADFALTRLLTGAEQPSPRWERCVALANAGMGELVGQAFVAERFVGASKQTALTMIGHVERAFTAGLPALAWMDPATRDRAREKMSTLRNKVGYPARWRDHAALRQSSDDHLGNVLAARRLEFVRTVDRIGEPVDRDEWRMAPAVVDAYYDPSANEMVFPAGVLQPPFFSAEFPMAMNFGGIGMGMGHELTHGFDDRGRKFDPQGVLREWWEPGASARFRARARCIEQAYAGVEVLPGLRANGVLTLSENIADFGGIKAAHAGYRAWQAEHHERSPIAGLSGDQLFFLGFAQSWCTLATDEHLRLSTAIDAHSLPRERVNVPLAHFPGFWDAWQCGPGTPMHAAEACEVW